MRCDHARELLSARLDGELSPIDDQSLDTHVAGCSGCAGHVRRLETVHARMRVRPAEAVPDLTEPILATALASRRSPAQRRWRWRWLAEIGMAQVAVAAAAVTQLLVALPLFFVSDGAAAAHASRELGAFSVAFGIGLLVVVWQPRRASGLLPMAGALVATMLLAGVADLVSGAAAPAEELLHVSELVGLAGLWAMARRSAGTSQGRVFA